MAETARVVPFLAYEDGVVALGWLTRVFGFVERERILETDGRLGHGTLETPGGGTVFLASPPHYVNPLHQAQASDALRKALDNPYVVDGVYVAVDDVDAYYASVKAAGATIIRELQTTDHGRLFTAQDVEGHRWMFMQNTG